MKDVAALDNAIRTGREKPETKVFLRNKLSTEKQAFLEKGELPTSDLLLPPVLKYLTAVRKARQPLSTAYSQAIAKALKANDQKAANALVEKKAALDKQAGDIGKFKEGSRWNGTRHGAKAAVSFQLNVGKLQGAAFQGQVWMNDGLVGMQVAGETDGNALTFRTVKMLKGENRNLTFTGFVFGNRIVAEVSGITPGKTRATGLVSLRAN